MVVPEQEICSSKSSCSSSKNVGKKDFNLTWAAKGDSRPDLVFPVEMAAEVSMWVNRSLEQIYENRTIDERQNMFAL